MPTEPSLVNACHSSKRFLQVPDEVILRYTSRPEVAAVFVLLARLSEVARGPIDLSRSDLPCWFDADRDDRIGVAIERALRTLRADGWLIHMNQGRREKRRCYPPGDVAVMAPHAHGALIVRIAVVPSVCARSVYRSR